MENPSRSRTARATAVPRSAAVRQTRGGSHSASRLPGRGLPRLEVLPLESHCREPGGAQQLSRPRDRKADRARSRVAAAGIPPSKRATAVLTRAPEWGTLSDGGKKAGRGKRETPGVRRRVKSRSARRGRKRRAYAKQNHLRLCRAQTDRRHWEQLPGPGIADPPN